MPSQPIGILHPGAMGSSIANSARNSGCEVYWVAEGRSAASRERAQGLTDAGTLARLCQICPIIISVCPPEFATAMADQIVAAGFQGVYVDANAVAPQHKIEMAGRMEAAGIRFVDGGIIGLPSNKLGETTLLLSGAAASEVAEYFTLGPIVPQVMGPEIGRASALKICFAAYNKGMIALYTALYGTAAHYGVLEELKGHFVHRGLSVDSIQAQILRAAPKVWRWVPEMHEIAETLEAAGMPGGFHLAAAEVYARLAGFKDAGDVQMDAILGSLSAAPVDKI
ncbi:MAG: DUF1932 domain-containing protein [Acidobacteriota bacterium]